jgi:hypothetical protein
MVPFAATPLAVFPDMARNFVVAFHIKLRLVILTQDIIPDYGWSTFTTQATPQKEVASDRRLLPSFPTESIN